MKRLADSIREFARSKKQPDESFTEAMKLYLEYCRTKTCPSQEAETAFLIFEDSTQREILEALILGGCPDEDIHTAFRVPVKSIHVYKELFFDIRNFRTDLERISYLEDYPDSFGRELKIRASNLGYEYVLYTYGNIVPKSSAQKALVQKMFLSSAYKAMNMNYSSMTSATMKAAVEHGKLMLKAYETLEKINSEDSNDNYNLMEVIPASDKTYETYEPLDGDLI